MTSFIRKHWRFFAAVKAVLCKIPAVSRIFAERDRLREALRKQGAQPPDLERIDAFLRILAAEILVRIKEKAKLVPLAIPNFADTTMSLYVYDNEDLDKYISACIRKYGVWEPVETEVLLSILRKDDYFIDIGANIGYYSILAARVVGSRGSVVAFEPEPSNFALLSASRIVNALSNLRVVNAAVSDRQGKQELFVSATNRGDNRLGFGDGTGSGVSVETVTLDASFLPKDASQRLIVKIDTQGWEAAIILGNLDFLNRAAAIVFEWSPRWIERNGHNPVTLIEKIEQRGFSISRIDEGARGLRPFGSAMAREILPKLMKAAGTVEDPMFFDLVAEKNVKVS